MAKFPPLIDRDVIADFLRFLWNRSSERACCLIILLAGYLSDRDLKQLEEYFGGLHDLRKKGL